MDTLEWVGLVVFVAAWHARYEWSGTMANQTSAGMRRFRDAKVTGKPPPWLFGVAWTILYTLIGLAGFFFWKTQVPGATQDWVLAVYWLGIVPNKLWSRVFFDMDMPGLALAVLLLTFGLAVATVSGFAVAGKWLPFGLYLAYPVWLLYAGYLNAMMLGSSRKPPPQRV